MKERTVYQSISKRHVLSVAPSSTIYNAACVMAGANCGSVLIIDGNALVGIVTERDLMVRVLAKAVDPATTTVDNIMTRNPDCVTPDTKVADAVLLMIERGYRHLPIVGHGNKIMGVFSSRDVMPQEMQAAESLAKFNDNLNDALG